MVVIKRAKKSVKIEHYAFRASILIKGFDSAVEIIIGAVLMFITAGGLYNFVTNLFSNEIAVDPRDFVATHIISWVSSITPDVKIFIAIYFLSHGLIKLGLLIGLWKEKVKLYPIAIGVFVLFIIYQAYKYIIQPSGWLIYLTVLDLIFIGLAILEYRHLKEHLIEKKNS